MGVSVYVMPLATYVAGSFRTSWGPDGDGGDPPRPGLPPEEAGRCVEAFRKQLEQFIPRLPEWDESGPARTATTFSLEGFSLPFLLARQWAHRLKLPRLGRLEPPQIWLPAEFEPAFNLPVPWSPDARWLVASSPGLRSELLRLLRAIEQEGRPELGETHRVAGRLIEIAALGVEHDAPVIVEG
jgi:hypothetical protein